MYAQYQYYQQQPSAATVSSQQTWNGSAWVTTNSSVQSASTYSTYEQPQKPALPNKIPENPVTAYTNYYHSWLAHGKECEEYLRQLPAANTKERAETKSRIDWAKYYADESSRAAHHFYQNPNATSAPFNLPPAPPESNKKALVNPSVSATHKQPAPTAARGKSSSDEITPGSLTRYVKKCLEQCTTEEQRKSIQSEVEKVIAAAIQNNTLHSKNWDLETLIPVPGAPRTSSFPQQYNHGQFQSFDLHSKRTQNHSKGKSNQFSNSYDDKLPGNDSYYGRGASTSPSTNKQVLSAANQSFGNRKSSIQSDASYYGPSTSSPYSSSYYNPNTSSPGDSPSSRSSQKKHLKRLPADFIPFQPKSKKLKNASSVSVAGFETSHRVLAKRQNRFSGAGGLVDASNAATKVNGYDKYMGKAVLGGSQKKLDEEDFEKMTVKGTCLKLKKEYLRLTSPPRAELVRPQPVLERHLANLKQDYADKNHDYLWFCSQFKAVRQDCTVQRIQDAFAVDVYETHAKIALQEGDLNEYNQCQTQLKELYETGEAVENQSEFIAYRLLYYVFLSTNEKYDGGSSDMFKIMLPLTPQQRSHPAIAHALKVREALAFGDYHQFFRLHENTPNLGRYLTGLILPTMRIRALRRMAKAYRPLLELAVCLRRLGFETAPDEGKKYLVDCGCVIAGSDVIMKDSTIHEPVVDKKNSLI